MTLDLDTIDIHRPQRYAEQGFPWGEWDLLRREAPVFWYERDDIDPFWAITRYADVMTISDNPRIFINGGPRLRLALRNETELLRGGIDAFGRSRGWDPDEPPDMVFMDNPRHRHVRKLSSWAYTQGGMRKMRPHFAELASRFADEFVEALERDGAAGVPSDFVRNFSAKLPLAATGELMGLAPDDWKKILAWSNAVLGEVEPEDMLPGEDITAAAERNMNEFRAYLELLLHESRENGAGRGGFIDHLVHREVQGRPLNDQQLIGYLLLLIAAGNDTTRNATSGGLIALLEHPDQRDLLCARPELVDSAAEEILRWSSPVISFLRTATEDFTVSDTTIRAGDTVCVFYPSANRDEAVFEGPYRFDITRDPNPHITFGYGAHFCLGTNLAKAELRAMLAALIPILPRLELAGRPERVPNTHVSGYARLPVRLAA
jgi:cholest-4-en-3-one 26-monooxygenase